MWSRKIVPFQNKHLQLTCGTGPSYPFRRFSVHLWNRNFNHSRTSSVRLWKELQIIPEHLLFTCETVTSYLSRPISVHLWSRNFLSFQNNFSSLVMQELLILPEDQHLQFNHGTKTSYPSRQFQFTCCAGTSYHSRPISVHLWSRYF